MHTDNHPAAIAAAQQAVHDRPDDFAAFEALARAHFEALQYDEAMAAYRRAIQLNPRTAGAREGIGHIHYRRGELQAAIQAYEQAIAIDPHYLNSYFGLGILHATKTGDFTSAIAAYQRGLAANPGDPFLTANLGSTYARAGQVDRAIEFLEQAAQDAPDEPYAWGWLSLLYLHQHRFEDALASCRRQNELEDDHSSYRMMGFIHHAQGRTADAAAAFERAVAIEPADYEARAALARVLRETGQVEAADEQYQRALEDAWQGDAEYGRACVMAVSGDFAKAVELIEVALAKRQLNLGWLRIDPEFAFLQGDPRYEALFDQPEPR